MPLPNQSHLPILYSFRRCPYAIRARLSIVLAGLTVELREVKLRDKPAAMLDASPKGTVPVLVLTDGTVLDESLEIMRWTMGWEGSTLVEQNDDAFKGWLDKYKYPERHPEHDVSFYRDHGLEFLRGLDERLSDSPFLGGERAGFEDVAIVPFVRQFAGVDTAWFQRLPLVRLQTWLDDWTGSVVFRDAMTSYPRWVDGSGPFEFPIETWDPTADDIASIVAQLQEELFVTVPPSLVQSFTSAPPAHPSFLVHRIFLNEGWALDHASDQFMAALEIVEAIAI